MALSSSSGRLRRCLSILAWMLAWVVVAGLLAGCALPRVSAEERLFLDLSLDFLGDYRLPPLEIEGVPLGGLSGVTYDPQSDRFYAISDDRGQYGPARFYTLALQLDTATPETIRLMGVDVEQSTPLSNSEGQPYEPGMIDPEGIALSPQQSVYISSEGVARDGIPPFVNKFDLATGAWQGQLPMPLRYLPRTDEDGQPQGVQDNLGFEALTLNSGGFSTAWLEPFRLFTATESSLEQDQTPDALSLPPRSRLLHYLIGSEQPLLISEHLYLVDPEPTGAAVNGLVELLVLDQGGHFLSLERSFGLTGFGAQLFQVVTGGATDTSAIASLKGDISGIQPIRKQLLLDLGELAIPLDNLEGMTLGPPLPDGSRSLLLVSDDNFNADQSTQFMLFRLKGLP